jgi:hypothetical protein
MAEYLLRIPPELKQRYKQLVVFSSFPVYSNAAAALQPIDQQKKVPAALQNRNRAEAPKVSNLYAVNGKKTIPFLSIACVRRIDGKHLPIRKSGSLLGIPNFFFVPYLNSHEATRVLRFLYDHLCPAPVSLRQQSIGIMFRPYQQISVIQEERATVRSRVEESLMLYREMEHREGMAEALWMSGKVQAARGDHALARTLYEDSLAMAQEIGDKELIVSSLEGPASVVAMQGELSWATRLWGTAEALREAIGVPLQPVERADYEQAVATARDHLGEETFDSAWTEGRSMTAAQVLTTGERAIRPQHSQQNQHPLK